MPRKSNRIACDFRRGVRRKDSVATPEWLYKALDAEFAFDLDPCPLADVPNVDGLTLDWNGRRVFCNPPYSAIAPWIKKGLASSALVVFLIPKRFDSMWCRLLRDAKAEFRLFERQFRFELPGGASARPFSGSMVVIVRHLHKLYS